MRREVAFHGNSKVSFLVYYYHYYCCSLLLLREHALRCKDGENCVAFQCSPVSGPSSGVLWADRLLRKLVEELCHREKQGEEKEEVEKDDEDNWNY